MEKDYFILFIASSREVDLDQILRPAPTWPKPHMNVFGSDKRDIRARSVVASTSLRVHPLLFASWMASTINTAGFSEVHLQL